MRDRAPASSGEPLCPDLAELVPRFFRIEGRKLVSEAATVFRIEEVVNNDVRKGLAGRELGAELLNPLEDTDL